MFAVLRVSAAVATWLLLHTSNVFSWQTTLNGWSCCNLRSHYTLLFGISSRTHTVAVVICIFYRFFLQERKIIQTISWFSRICCPLYRRYIKPIFCVCVCWMSVLRHFIVAVYYVRILCIRRQQDRKRTSATGYDESNMAYSSKRARLSTASKDHEANSVKTSQASSHNRWPHH